MMISNSLSIKYFFGFIPTLTSIKSETLQIDMLQIFVYPINIFYPHAIFHSLDALPQVLISILLSWGLCAILTSSGWLSEDSAIRTDTAGDLISNSRWIRVPYPCQWGAPTVSVAAVFGMLAGVLSSIVESVGDYYAAARLSGRPDCQEAKLSGRLDFQGGQTFR